MSLVVVGTGTEVGKTVASAVVLARYGGRIRLGYWKPIQTGSREERDTETVRWLTASRAEVLPELYLFELPASPHLAARREGARIDPERVLEALVAHGLEAPDRSLIIEGAGGFLVPLTDTGYLFADIFGEMHLPCLIVGTSTLGTINHTLLTIEAVRARRLEIAGVALVGPPDDENRRAIERFGGVRVVGEIPPIDPLESAGVRRAARSFDREDVLMTYLE